MTVNDLQSEQFMTLLTDALLAGPGSPQWQEAVSILRRAGAEGDEYAMLITAREHLESGRQYRAVRPGPNFTRKVLTEIEQTTPRRSLGGSPATWIALAAIVLVAAMIGLLVYVAAPRDTDTGSLAELDRTYFVQPRVVTDFSGTLAPDWQPIGQLEVQPTRRGLRLAATQSQAEGDDGHLGGGVVTQQPLAGDQPFAVEVQLRTMRLNDDLIPQLFIADSAEFSPDRGTSGRELVYLVQNGRSAVALPDGRLADQADFPAQQARNGITIRIAVNARHATVDVAGQRLYAGPHQLDPAKPRYVGVRFLSRGEVKPDQATFESLRILHPQGTADPIR